jgi:hypothetical protein
MADKNPRGDTKLWSLAEERVAGDADGAMACASLPDANIL